MKQIVEIYKKISQVITYATTNKDKVLFILNDIDTIINSIKLDASKDIKQIIYTNQGYLFKIHDVLVGKFAKLYLSPPVLTIARKVHDKLFNLFNIKQPRKRFAYLATFLATNFCQGITYFSNNSGIERKPYYHRDNSCGDFNRQKTSLTKDQLKTCYIERLIYDKIYTHVFYEQDLGHLYELKSIEVLFQNIFKKLELNIIIKFSDGIHPDSIIISESYNNIPPKYTTYIYNKRWGSNLVHCQKYQDDQKYSKVQTYEQEEPFMLSADTF